MHRKNVRLQTVFLAIVLAIACQTQAYEYAALPPATDIQIKISNIAGVTNAVKETALGRWWQDQEVQAFLGHPDMSAFLASLLRGTNAANEQKARLEAEQWRMLKGELIMAIDLPPAKSEDVPTIYVAAQLSEEDYRKSLELDRQIAELDSRKTKISRDTFQDQELVMIVQEDRDGRELKTWQTCLHNTLIASSSREWVEATVARIKREGPPAARTSEAPSVDLTLSGAMIRKQIKSAVSGFNAIKVSASKHGPRRQNQDDNQPGPSVGMPHLDADAILKAAGLDTLQTIQIAMQFAKNQSNIKFVTDRGAARGGIWKMFDEQPLPGDVIKLPYVPAELTSFSVSRLNLPALWQELPNILQAIDPSAAAMLTMMAGMSQQMYGFDINSDVMANIGNVVAIIGYQPEEQLFALQIKDSAAADNVLRQIASKTPNVGEADFRGTPICHFKNPTNANDGIALATAGKFLYIGKLEQVHAAIRAQTAEKPVDPAFFQSAIYRAMLRNKPRDAVSADLSDFQATVKTWFSQDNVAKMKKMVQSPCAKNNQLLCNLLGGIDFAKMPTAEKMASFFGPVYGYTTIKGNLIAYEQIIVDPQPNKE